MPNSLQLGVATLLTPSITYALPTKLSYVTSTLALEHSVDGTTWAALTGANTVGCFCGSNFIKSAGAASVICKDASKADVTIDSGGGGGASATITDFVAIGTNPAQSGGLRLTNNLPIKWRNAANNGDLISIYGNTGEILVIDSGAGIAIVAPTLDLSGSVLVSKYLRFVEMTAPGVAANNMGYLFMQDNGAGKTQLMVQFSSGTPIQLAIQV